YITLFPLGALRRRVVRPLQTGLAAQTLRAQAWRRCRRALAMFGKQVSGALARRLGVLRPSVALSVPQTAARAAQGSRGPPRGSPQSPAGGPARRPRARAP